MLGYLLGEGFPVQLYKNGCCYMYVFIIVDENWKIY